MQSSKTNTGAGGTGLGLAICKEIVAAHGGTISVVNNVQAGVTFTLTLPRHPAAPTTSLTLGAQKGNKGDTKW
jgi:signal transduction histidine kinase